MSATASPSPGEQAFAALALAARVHGRVLDPARLAREHCAPGRTPARHEWLRAARAAGLKAAWRRAAVADLERLPLPAVARLTDGRAVVVAAAREGRVLVHDPARRRPLAVDAEELAARWPGEVLLVAPRARAREAARFGLRWFVPVLARYRRHLVEVLVASAALQVLGLATPLFFQVVIDKVLVHHGLTTLDVLAVGFAAVVVFEAAIGGLRDWLAAHTGHRVDAELGARVFRHLMRLPLAWYRARRVGDTVARVRELDRIRELLTGSALTLLIDVTFALALLVVMALYSVKLTLVVAAFVPAWVLLSLTVTPVLRRRLEQRFRLGADNHAFLVESLGGVETARGLAAEPLLARRWEEGLARYLSRAFAATRLASVAGHLASLIGRLATLAILWLGAREVMAGTLSVGELVAFNMLAGQVNGPVLRLVRLWQDLQQAVIGIERLGDILDAPPEPQAPEAGSGARLRGHVRLEKVTFRYAPGREPVLDGLTLDIPAGAFVGIVGASGSGKSTLVRLIPRLWVPEAGRVAIDGIDVGLMDPLALRRQVVLVPQEAQLFRGTVRDNIALADPAAELARVVAAARLAGAHEFIERLPQGYATEVGEQGLALSGGQRQRIAIARALLADPRVLILDESTSALDYAAERRIRDNLAAIRRGRTLVVVAHRLSAVRDADAIAVIEGGRVAELGTDAELLARGGHYAALVALERGQGDGPRLATV